MKTHTINKQQVLKQWQRRGIVIDPEFHSISLNGSSNQVEPMVMELLMLLLEQPNKVFSKDRIIKRLWPERIVNEEALTKLVSKLRQALGDDPRQARFIKTIPRKGYLLMADQATQPSGSLTKLAAAVACAVLAGLTYGLWPESTTRTTAPQEDELQDLLHKAESHYYQYQRLDNESAIKLYEQIMARDDNHALSQSGLANALVQRVLRWPEPHADNPAKHINLTTTLASGRLDSDDIRAQLSRAEGLAERAIKLAPESGKAHRSLGLVYAVQQRFDLAAKMYLKAIELDPDEWGAMINLSEIHSINNQPEMAVQSLIRAHQAMTRNYQQDEVIIRPWYTELATTIADRSVALGLLPEAEIWYRKALDNEPYHEAAMRGLMAVLSSQGHHDDAAVLCFELQQKVDPRTDCS